jgi:Uma2 family endonuclease
MTATTTRRRDAASPHRRRWWQPPEQGRWTRADYRRLPDNGLQYELLDGELIMTPAPNRSHQDVIGNLYFAIRQHIGQKGRGWVMVAPFDVFLGPEDHVQPDVLFVAQANLHIVRNDGVYGAPDFVAEALSPGREVHDRSVKLKLYLQAGVREYWIIDPLKRTIEVFVKRQGRAKYVQVGTFKPGERVNSEVIEGLAVKVEDVCRR